MATKYHFDDGMLPILGVVWRRFDTEKEARAFAAWAERTTKHHAHPCEAFVMSDQAGENGDQWEVKVRNW